MGKSVVAKSWLWHLVSGDLVPGAEVALKIAASSGQLGRSIVQTSHEATEARAPKLG